MSRRDVVEAALTLLKRHATRATLKGMARYALPTDRAYGVSVANIQVVAKRLGRSHDLALGLWETGVFEARMLTAFVDEVDRVTSAQMDRWCAEFDNWGIVDTLCFKLWDQTPHAWDKVNKWAKRRDEFGKRAAFAMLWSLALHDKKAADGRFVHGLALIEEAARDDRNFVKKAVAMALRAVGHRRSLKAGAADVARRLAGSTDASSRWVGKDALRKLR